MGCEAPREARGEHRLFNVCILAEEAVRGCWVDVFGTNVLGL